jgi:hypothetical protein
MMFVSLLEVSKAGLRHPSFTYVLIFSLDSNFENLFEATAADLGRNSSSHFSFFIAQEDDE